MTFKADIITVFRSIIPNIQSSKMTQLHDIVGQLLVPLTPLTEKTTLNTQKITSIFYSNQVQTAPIDKLLPSNLSKQNKKIFSFFHIHFFLSCVKASNIFVWFDKKFMLSFQLLSQKVKKMFYAFV